MMKEPLFNFSQTYIEHGYLELCIPPIDDKVRLRCLSCLNVRNVLVESGQNRVRPERTKTRFEYFLRIIFFPVCYGSKFSPHLATWRVHDDSASEPGPHVDRHAIHALC